MRLKNYLDEKYLGPLKYGYDIYSTTLCSIYENPTKTEIKLALEESKNNELRFICDDWNKKVFIWSADIIHSETWNLFLYKKLV